MKTSQTPLPFFSKMKVTRLQASVRASMGKGCATVLWSSRSSRLWPRARVRNSRGRIMVCGEVNGRNTAGRQAGMSPFVGVLMGPDVDADFVLVGIGSSGRERAEVIQLCRASGIYGVK
jgi:hypothetical protein